MRLAIVIPTLNEEKGLASQIRRAQAAADLVVVADGGSQDKTPVIAEESGAEVVRSEPGRGPQLNCGARRALALGAEALLFLHADTALPDEARTSVTGALRNGAVGGGFLVRFDDPSRLLRLGARLVNRRTRWLKVPLGDQAQFATAEAYDAVDGFPDWPILEDLEFIRRLRRFGEVSIVAKPVLTDARRFRQRGIFRTVATNWLIWALYLLRIHPRKLAGLYQHVR